MKKQSLSGLAASIAFLGQILAISTQGSLSRPRRDSEIPEEFIDTGKFKNPEKETPPMHPSEILSILSRYRIESFNSKYSENSIHLERNRGNYMPPSWRPGKSDGPRRRW